MAEASIRLDRIAVKRGRTSLLGPISLRIKRGDFWGIVGPNGAGKTTLLRTLAGLEQVSSGRIVYAGFGSVNEAQSPRVMRRRIGMLPQHHDYNELVPITVEDVVSFGRLIHSTVGSRMPSRDHHRVQQAIRKMGLDSLRNRLYRELSGGERQKVQFARLLAQEAELLLLDEPTAGLDLDWQERVTILAQTLYSLSETTIVMVTHDVDRLPECCNNVLLIRQGKKLAEGGPTEVFENQKLSDLYGCEMEVVSRGKRFHAFSIGPGKGED